MEKILKLYKKIEGKSRLLAEVGIPILAENGVFFSAEKPHISLFPNDSNQIIITDFEYNAVRMGATPYISAKVKYKECLDDFWDENVYAEFNGERYFVMNAPSSKKNNEDERYEHEINLLSEREILNCVYFIDAVQQDETIDKVKSNSTKVIFMGDIHELVARLNSSLSYSNLDYTVVVDEGIETDNILVSFEDKYFYEALQEGYNLYKVPFYFDGKTIHFGYTSNAIPNVFRYGFENALLSISKQNANYKITTRCTGYGSSENLPYYYPNATAKGNVKAIAANSNKGLQQSNIQLVNRVLFCDKFNSTDSLQWSWIDSNECVEVNDIELYYTPKEGDSYWYSYKNGKLIFTIKKDNGWQESAKIRISYRIKKKCKISFDIKVAVESSTNDVIHSTTSNPPKNGEYEVGEYVVESTLGFMRMPQLGENILAIPCTFDVSLRVNSQQVKGWSLNNEDSIVDISKYGIKLLNITEDQLVIGDIITQEIDSLIPYTGYLMPPIYRQTSGAEQFYNAQNNKYPLPEGEGYYTFENEYNELSPHEMKVSFEDIKPTIVGITNSLGQRIDKFLDFAWDNDDNDEIDEDGNYLHLYFFAKLAKFDGDNGFNLFDHASEQGVMTISMTSKTCGACNFEIRVGEETQKNTVQVDDNGNLKRDANGNVLWENQIPQDRQNDTSKYEVWIALKKDDATYGTILPSKKRNLVPSIDDTFVILNINLPQAYIDAAEKKLEDEIIKYMSENNVEKFNFDISFSRIYLAQNPQILAMLNENARIIIEYNGQQHTLYVDSYTYKMSSSESLPEISVTLTDTLNVGTNSLRNAITNVTKDIMNGSNGDILAQGTKYFLRKDVEDAAQKTITFEQGLKSNNIESKNFTSGTLGSGHRLFTNPNTGESYCEVDRLYVRMKAYFDTLDIKEVSHIGGELILTPASIKCNKVEIIKGNPNIYRCYFNNNDGEQAIQNQFVIGDLAYCKQFNIVGGIYTNISNRFYWYEVTNIGTNYIEITEGKCAEGSDIPKEGDTIVSLGNKTNPFRQNAIILSTVGINAPSKILYQGIDDYSLSGKAIIEEGFDSESNQAYQKIYGKSYIGAKDESCYISFDPTTKRMKVKAELEILGGTGFENIEGVDKFSNDALAKNMGYDSYEDMVLKAAEGKTIISGGYINTTLIQAKAITADMINADGIVAKDANITGEINATSGTFENVTVNGSIRSPFKYATFFGDVKADNLIVPNTNKDDGYILMFSIPDAVAENIGRRITISFEHGYGRAVSQNVPIWRNGKEETTSISLYGGQTVDLLGYGIKGEFKAWIVIGDTMPSEVTATTVTATTVTATYFSPNPYDKNGNKEVWYGLSVLNEEGVMRTKLNGFYGVYFNTGSGSMTLDNAGGNVSISGKVECSGYKVNDGGMVYEGITETITLQDTYGNKRVLYFKNGLLYKVTY